MEGTTVWSDHDGEEVYGDYMVTATKTWDEQNQEWVYGPPELHNVAAYLLGIGRMDSVTGAVTYHHADHLGTLRVTSDAAGQISSHLVLTAFGETVAADGTVETRYQYAGEWGYETGLGSPGAGGSAGQTGLPWQHVGHRWYDPSTGRFLQRDPIGIWGGLNLYEYLGSNPTATVDPRGLLSWGTFWGKFKFGVKALGAGALSTVGIHVVVHYGCEKGGAAAQRLGVKNNITDIVLQDAQEQDPSYRRWTPIHPDNMPKQSSEIASIEYLVRANGRDISVIILYKDGHHEHRVIPRT